MLPLIKTDRSFYADPFGREDDFDFWQKTVERLSEKKMSWEDFLEIAERPLARHPAARLATQNEGRTLLHLAVLQNQTDVIADLKHNASLILRRDAFGLTAGELARFLGREELPSKIPFCRQPQLSVPDSETPFENLVYLPYPVFETQKGFEDILLKTKKAKAEDQIPPEKIWMGIYFDKELQKAIHPAVSIRHIDAEIGYGVFAEQRIPSCSFAGEYTGIIQERKRKHLKDKYYCLRYTTWEMGNRNFVIDAEEQGNFTRFINHSAKPNLGLQSVYWRGLPRMIFVALREIAPGTQLTFDYGSFFWKESQKTPKLLE